MPYKEETAASKRTVEQIQMDVKRTLEQVMGESSAEMLNEMSLIFLEDAVPLIDQIKTGYVEGDLAAIRMAAHALKGSSATIGLEHFAHITLIVENSSKANDNAAIAEQLPALEAEYERIKQALTSFLL